MDGLAMPWVNARVAHLLPVNRMMPVEVGNSQEERIDVNGCDQLIYTQNAETIEPFSFQVMPVKAGKAYGGRMQ